MRIHLPAAIIVVFSMLCTQAAVWGQGTRSLFGTGGTLGGSVTAGSRNFAGGTGQTGQVASGEASELVTGLQQMTQQFVSSTARFTREGRQPGQFVGTSSQEMQGFVGSVQAGQTTGQQGRMGLRSGSGLQGVGRNRTVGANRPGAAAGRRRSTTQIRVSIGVGFRRPIVAPARVSRALAQRLSNCRRVQVVSPVEVVIQGRTATLRGVVATQYDRALAEQLARLEAGIGQVRNELVVAVAPAEPELPAPDAAGAEPPVPPPVAP